MENLFNPAGLAALITALFTGAGGTWLAFKQFHVNRAKTVHEIEASLRSELREDIEKYRKDTEDLRDKVTRLFEENLTLKHTNANLMQQIRALNGRLDRLNNEKKKSKVATNVKIQSDDSTSDTEEKAPAKRKKKAKINGKQPKAHE